MLNIVQGRSGTGKTKYVTEMLGELAKKGNTKLLYLIPEQSSFESETRFLKMLGPMISRRINVMSFTRLYDMVMRSTGGFSGTAIDDGVKRIMMSLALEDCRNELELYGKQALKPQLAELMLTAVREFKTCAVSTDVLRKNAYENRTTELGQKLYELALITDVYNSYVEKSYIDPLDNNARLEKRLMQVKFFEGYTIVMDGFTGFTAQEINIAKLLMEQADEFYITVGMDVKDSTENLFFDINRMKNKFIQLAENIGEEIRYAKKLSENYRIKSSGISKIEKGIYRISAEPSEGISEGVTVAEAEDIFEECSFVADSIYRIAVSGECRYRDIAVVCRNSEDYKGILDSAFESRGIPYFMSKPYPIDTKPLMLLVLSAFEYVITMNSDKIFSIAKCGLLNVTDYDVSLLENYAYIWNLKGKRFKEDFISPPDGYGSMSDEYVVKSLERLNEIRQLIIAPLISFEEKIKKGGAKEISQAVYELLIEYKVDKNIRHSKDEFADEEIRLWDYLMDLLNKMYLSLAERDINYKRYYELFLSVVRCAQISDIPQTLDQVTIGTADSIRLNNPYAVFVIGATDGVFPHTPVQGGVFSDSERRMLISQDVPLYDALEELFLHEKYLVYNAVSAPTDKLCVTYYKKDLKGGEVKPSSIVSEIIRLLPDVKINDISLMNDADLIYSEKTAFEKCTLRYNMSDPLSVALKEYFSNEKAYKDKLKAVERAVKRKDYRIENKELAMKLFGGNKSISASQIESYNKCRFQYYCNYGLKLKERRRASMDAIEYGSLVHYLLENTLKYYKSHDYEKLEDEQLSELLDTLMDDYLENELGGTEDKSERFKYLYSRVKRNAEKLIRRMDEEFATSDFRPVDFELAVGKDDGIEGYSVTDANENTVTVSGIIDRVDLMQRNGKKYIRIVDYKTGAKEFKLSDVLYGLNMQMLIYLSAIAKNGEARYGEEIVPSGVLYMPATVDTVSVDANADDKIIQNEHDKKLKMNGLLLNDEEVYKGMDKSVSGRFVPISTCKSGTLSAASQRSLITADQLDMVFEKVDKQIAKMSEELNEGRIEAVPVSGSYSPCDWCEYKSICARDKNEKERPIVSMKTEEVLKSIKQENGEAE